jgi:Cellulase (glycosyl hydrolase family 5)
MKKGLVAAVLAAALCIVGVASAALFTFGSTDATISATKDSLDLKELGVSILTSPKAGTLNTATGGKVEGYMDGLGKASGSEKVRMVIYSIDANNNPTTLLGVSAEQTINAGTAASWRSFSFPSAISIPAGKIGVGYWAGGTTTQLIRPSYDINAGTIKYRQNVTYSSTGNPPNPFGTASTGSAGKPWAIRVTADDGTTPVSLPKFGITADGNDFQASTTRQNTELADLQDLHAKIIRVGCGNPSGGGTTGFNFAKKFADVGIRPLCLIASTPSWDYPGVLTNHPTSDMANECTVAAQNFDYANAIIEPINEPDLHGWNGTAWEPYQVACYNAVKAVDPNLLVIFPGMFEGSSGNTVLPDFVRDYYAAGGKNYYQVMNVHLYDDPSQCGLRAIWAETFGCATQYQTYNVRQQMNANGDASKPIMATEAGSNLGASNPTGQSTVWSNSMGTVDGIGTGDHKLISWLGFTLYDDPLSCCVGFGIASGTDAVNGPWTPRPAYTTFKNIAIAAGQ